MIGVTYGCIFFLTGDCINNSYNKFKVRGHGVMRLLAKSIGPTGGTHTATVVFFHGSGDSGSNIAEWVNNLLGREMAFPHIKVIYPTAPAQPYTPWDGDLSNVWFDRTSVSIEAKEKRKSLAKIYEEVHELLNAEIKNGMAPNRIIIGGFSMGGTLAMHTAFHLNTELAGVFAFSAFLNRNSIVYDSIQNRSKNTPLPELIMYHGDKDETVPIDWGQETYNELKNLGVRGEFTRLSGREHELSREALIETEHWIVKKLPPLNKL